MFPLKSADQNRLQVFRNDCIYKWTVNLVLKKCQTMALEY